MGSPHSWCDICGTLLGHSGRRGFCRTCMHARHVVRISLPCSAARNCRLLHNEVPGRFRKPRVHAGQGKWREMGVVLGVAFLLRTRRGAAACSTCMCAGSACPLRTNSVSLCERCAPPARLNIPRRCFGVVIDSDDGWRHQGTFRRVGLLFSV